MRPLKLFLLQSEEVFEYRGRIFVWFLQSFINPVILLLFWRGAIEKSGGQIGEFTLSTIVTFYFLLIIANSLLIVHIEESISLIDIKEGALVRYLLRPISYYWIKFNEEFSYRLMQGFYATITVVIFLVLFPNLIKISTSPITIITTIMIAFLAYFISFTYKMCLGLITLWMIDAHGFFQLMEVILILLSGMTVPISLMPNFLASVSLISPFPYIIYFPIISLQGKLTGAEVYRVLGMQFFWLIFFILLYKLLWNRGIYKFTAVGQ